MWHGRFEHDFHSNQCYLIIRFGIFVYKVFVPNSGPKQNDLGYPFGYIKASTNMMSVNLFVLPYNYPNLFQLISESYFDLYIFKIFLIIS